ncbi:MAG: hypothetical protein ABW005_11585 [Burkholderiaceae bacterium]
MKSISTADKVVSNAQQLAHNGLASIREGSNNLLQRAHNAGQQGVVYIKDEPIKSVLLAAAAGAALTALLGLAARALRR